MVCGNSSRVGDSLAFNTSSLKKNDNEQTIVNEDRRILVDSVFPDLPYLIKSTVRTGTGSARTRVEHCFGQLKSQFRLFMKRYSFLI